MRTKAFALLSAVCIVVALSGCSQTEPQSTENSTVSFSGSISEAPQTDDNSDNAETVSTENSQPIEVDIQSTEEQVEENTGTTVCDTKVSAGSVPPATTTSQSSTEQPNKPDKTEERAEQTSPSESEQTKPSYTEPEEAIPPKAEEAEQPETEETVTEPTTEPQFDIDYWLTYTKSYAESVGLILNSEAVYCWDNPIGAGSHCIYLERDIQSRLNRYAKDEDITDVWIWAEPTGNGYFDIYIGYA